MNRPTLPAGYSYCNPNCYCKNCRRLEAQFRAAPATRPIARPVTRCYSCGSTGGYMRTDMFGTIHPSCGR